MTRTSAIVLDREEFELMLRNCYANPSVDYDGGLCVCNFDEIVEDLDEKLAAELRVDTIKSIHLEHDFDETYIWVEV